MNTVKNKVQLSGNLGNTPEIRILDSGRKMARFSVATNDSYRNASGEWITQTQWHNIIAWGKVAEKAGEILNKGSEISLEGKLMNFAYIDKNGVKKYYTHVQASGFEPVARAEKELPAVQ